MAGCGQSEWASHGIRDEACEQTKSMTSLVRNATPGAVGFTDPARYENVFRYDIRSRPSAWAVAIILH
jgi:hypothetical protein